MSVFRESFGSVLKRLCYGVVALALLSVLSGVLVFGGRTVGAASDQQTTCNPVASTNSGVAQPTGSSAAAFTYDKCSGLYISAHYQYNPATQTYSPLPGSEPTYRCDESVWRWQKTEWQYVASESTYVQTTFYVDTAPSGYGTCSPPPPSAVSEQPGGTQSGSAADPSSTQGSTEGTSGSTNLDSNSTVGLTNNITSGATTGSASAMQNTQAGDVASGNALAAATVVNVVNSAGTTAAPVATFTRNINGDVNGNIVINIADLQPSNVDLNSTNNNTSVANSDGTIVNNLNVNASSGDATASANTKVGNVTSGSAAAMVGVVNMLNSMVSAGQSFIGTINVNGNLNGDILMPAQFMSNLKASGAPSTNVVISSGDLTNLSSSSATQIINQINSAAASGSVNSTRNTSSGNATSGSASTKVEVFNLTGQKIVGSNGLLVFVNVMGKWVGLIVGAPSGANAALLGGTMTPISSGGAGGAVTNAAITNNINVKATSGNVNSTSNTMAGNATSGTAGTAVDIANFVDNSISFGGWFGILFINVLGNWNGNFGELPVASQPVFAVAGSGVHPVGSAGMSFGFMPRSSGGTKMTSTKQNLTEAKLNNAVKAANIANINNNPGAGQGGGTSSAAENPSGTHWLIIAGSLFIASCLAAASRRKTI